MCEFSWRRNVVVDCDDGADRDALRRSGFGRGWWRETLIICGMYGYLASIAQVHIGGCVIHCHELYPGILPLCL